jgi:hypothetical protein
VSWGCRRYGGEENAAISTAERNQGHCQYLAFISRIDNTIVCIDSQARNSCLNEIGIQLGVASGGGEASLHTCLVTATLGKQLHQAIKSMEAHINWASSVMLEVEMDCNERDSVHKR